MNQQQCLDGAAGIVTGGGRGIGAAIARELSALGARLVLADLVADGVADVVEGITANGGEAVPVVADVRHYADTERLRDTCLGRFGRIDFSVANASMSDACTLVDGDPEHWRAVVETNVLGVAHTVRAVLPVMRATVTWS